jgi:hypothetical protein
MEIFQIAPKKSMPQGDGDPTKCNTQKNGFRLIGINLMQLSNFMSISCSK